MQNTIKYVTQIISQYFTVRGGVNKWVKIKYSYYESLFSTPLLGIHAYQMAISLTSSNG